jgi:hypothetical protein
MLELTSLIYEVDYFRHYIGHSVNLLVKNTNKTADISCFRFWGVRKKYCIEILLADGMSVFTKSQCLSASHIYDAIRDATVLVPFKLDHGVFYQFSPLQYVDLIETPESTMIGLCEHRSGIVTKFKLSDLKEVDDCFGCYKVPETFAEFPYPG